MYLPEDSEDRAICTSEFSDISPLTGGSVAFATLEGRPGALQFDYNLQLQDWVTATSIRISLNRLNTFGDEVFRDPRVLQSYYYAITDFAVGGMIGEILFDGYDLGWFIVVGNMMVLKTVACFAL